MDNINFKIDKMRDHWGTYTDVARILGISYRHLLNIRKGGKAGGAVEKLIGIHSRRIAKKCDTQQEP